MFSLQNSSYSKNYKQINNKEQHQSDKNHAKPSSGKPEDELPSNRPRKESSSITTYSNTSSSLPINASLTGGSSNSLNMQNPSYFDVRLKTNYKDMIVIAEDELEESKVFITGALVVSLIEPMSIKKISMQLVGNFKLDFIQTTGKHGYTTIVKETRPIFESLWDNLLNTSVGSITDLSAQKKKKKLSKKNALSLHLTNSNENLSSFRNPGRSSSPVNTDRPGLSTHGSATSLHGGDTGSPQHVKPYKKRSSSSASLWKKLGLDYISPGGLRSDSMNGLNSSNTGSFTQDGKRKIVKVLHPGDFVQGINSSCELENLNGIDYYHLETGNYEIPFSLEIPNNAMIPETVEGLQSGSVLYTVQATIDSVDKGKISNTKYIRVFKTLKVNNWAIHENLYVGQSFQDKLQYDIRLPSRAVPVGGESPISIKLFPFQKNYRIEKINVNMMQYYAVTDQHKQIFEEEQPIMQLTMQNFKNIDGIDPNTGVLIGDVHLRSTIRIPKNLKKITQDSTILENDTTTNTYKKLIMVRHQLSLRITLISPTNAVTEINCNMPIILYVSPYVPIETRRVVLDKATKIHFRPNETTPFFKSLLEPSMANKRQQGVFEGNANLIRYFPQEEFSAPPTYNERVTDRIIDGETINGLSHHIATAREMLVHRPLDMNSLQNINKTPSYDHTFYDSNNIATQQHNITATATTTTTSSASQEILGSEMTNGEQESMIGDTGDDSATAQHDGRANPYLPTGLFQFAADLSPEYQI
ncbi:hypothetical protein ACO0RG_000128 [Hanseniaspora osmophila]